jgi:ubiquinone/menaquinone biosynthesis C-methylase UbiE
LEPIGGKRRFAGEKRVIMSEYVLQVGEKGFDRLKFINDLFGEHSRNFLTRAGLREGSRVLEVGCGTGSMTTWIAKKVGKSGRVMAVDASEKQLEIARKAVEKSGVSNVEFTCSTIQTLEPSGDFDLAYSRLLLMHLKDPVGVLLSLRRFLKQGGVMACEEPHSSSLTTAPRNECIERLNAMFIELGNLQGLDFNIGDKLLGMMRSAGYSGLHGWFIQPVISMGEAIEFIRMSAVEIAPFAIKCEMVSEEEAKRMIRELEGSEFSEDAYYTFPRQAQVFGYS